MQLVEFANVMYSERDKSHGIEHVMKVKDNALLICKKMNISDKSILDKIEIVALFHDLWDHKYVDIDSDMSKEIKDKLYNELKSKYNDHDIDEIYLIINNISLSREMALRKENKYIDLKHLQLIRDIVSDADKLEMLGISGISRMIEYQMYKYPNTTSDELQIIIKDIYNNKISKLLSDNYINTNQGRELAIPLMSELIKYMNDNYFKTH